ncbi:MAG: hypothetical protein FGM24_10620 [Candidatus Kapabacteria bacterium]|nr:hypothetical protein [Candidatus Kapabacteria bacterium]
MIATVYLHPDRTIAARWRMDDVPVLLDLAFAEPVHLETAQKLPDALAQTLLNVTSVRFAIPMSATLMHRYPIEADESVTERRAFEIATCLPGLDHDNDYVLDQALSWEMSGSRWHALHVVPREVCDTIRRIAAGHPVDVVQLSAATEIRAAAMATFVRGNTLLVGRRADRWEILAAEPQGTIGHMIVRADDPNVPSRDIVRDIVIDVIGASGRQIDQCCIYGDDLDLATFESMQQALSDVVPNVARLVPFRAVKAEVPDSVRSTCLRLAHVIAPIVGLCQPVPNDLVLHELCASPADV